MAATKSKEDELSAQLDALKADMADLTQTMKNLGVAKVDDARAHAQDGVDQALDYVRDKPANALAVAAGMGFLIGLLSGRR